MPHPHSLSASILLIQSIKLTLTGGKSLKGTDHNLKIVLKALNMGHGLSANAIFQRAVELFHTFEPLKNAPNAPGNQVNNQTAKDEVIALYCVLKDTPLGQNMKNAINDFSYYFQAHQILLREEERERQNNRANFPSNS